MTVTQQALYTPPDPEWSPEGIPYGRAARELRCSRSSYRDTHSETTGALSPESLKSIAHLDKLANKPSPPTATALNTDGSRRGATRSFRRHHTSEVSSALVYADAETLLAHAEGAPV